MTDFILQVDKTNTPTKPSKNEIPMIQSRLTETLVKCLREFGEMVTPPHSYTWTGGIMPNGRKAKNWVSQQVFALDFDSGITPEEALEIGKTHDLTPNILYTSFSDSPELRKFRFVYVLDTAMIEPEGAKNLNLFLLDHFPMADKSCKDISRMFFGGKTFQIIMENFYSCPNLYRRLDLHFLEKDNNKTRKIIKSVQNRQTIGKSRGFKEVPTEESIKAFTKTKKFDNPDWETMANKILILKDFLEGVWLNHPQIFGLATSLHWFNGGQKLMKSTMNKFNSLGKTHYSKNNFNAVSYAAKMKYFPENLKDFSPYKSDHEFGSISQFARNKKGTIEVVKEYSNTDLKTVENSMERFIDSFMDPNTEPGIYLLNVPTGIGKTRKLSKLENVAIATPTHQLKDELLGRMSTLSIATLKLPEFKSCILNNQIQTMYDRGNFKDPMKIIRKISKNSKNRFFPEDSKMAHDYLQSIKSLKQDSSTNLLTTHARILTQPINKDRLIFDEDPLKSILKISHFTINDLINYERITSESGTFVKSIIQKAKKLIEDCMPGTILKTPDFKLKIPLECIEDSLNEQEILGNLNGFLTSHCFMKDLRNPAKIHYLTKNDLPPNKKILICSATVEEFYYDKLYGKENIKSSIKFPKVKQVGKIIQETGISCSRASIREKLDTLKSHVSDSKILTFKEFNKEFNKEVLKAHLGNCSGYDIYAGKNLSVVGTPHFNPETYLLIGYALGIPVGDFDWKMKDIEVERNGFRFKFKTFENPELQNIQFHMIESELIQAIGRARTLRENCEVKVFSNLPLQITTEFTLNLN